MVIFWLWFLCNRFGKFSSLLVDLISVFFFFFKFKMFLLRYFGCFGLFRFVYFI